MSTQDDYQMIWKGLEGGLWEVARRSFGSSGGSGLSMSLWEASGKSLKSVLEVPGRSLGSLWEVSGKCLWRLCEVSGRRFGDFGRSEIALSVMSLRSFWKEILWAVSEAFIAIHPILNAGVMVKCQYYELRLRAGVTKSCKQQQMGVPGATTGLKKEWRPF